MSKRNGRVSAASDPLRERITQATLGQALGTADTGHHHLGVLCFLAKNVATSSSRRFTFTHFLFALRQVKVLATNEEVRQLLEALEAEGSVSPVWEGQRVRHGERCSRYEITVRGMKLLERHGMIVTVTPVTPTMVEVTVHRFPADTRISTGTSSRSSVSARPSTKPDSSGPVTSRAMRRLLAIEAKMGATVTATRLQAQRLAGLQRLVDDIRVVLAPRGIWRPELANNQLWDLTPEDLQTQLEWAQAEVAKLEGLVNEGLEALTRQRGQQQEAFSRVRATGQRITRAGSGP